MFFKRVETKWGTVTRPTALFYTSIGLAIFLLLTLATSFRVVGVGKTGIVTQFGQIVSQRQSGAFFKLPWQGLHVMDIQTQKEQQAATAATHDLQSVNTTVAVNYHLTPDTARKVFQNVGADYKLRIIDPIIQESVKAITANYDAADLIGKRSQVEVQLNDLLTSKLTDRGITVDNVSIVDFGFSAAFDASIEAKQVAQQNAQKAAYELQTAQQRAQAQQVQGQSLTPEYLRLQELENQEKAIAKWNGVLPTTTLGSDSNALFNLQGR
jgi:regulator of protease activity HflC (stomatin/prohibitin superfamily)